MENLDIFQARFGKLDEFGFWDLEPIQTNNRMQFTSKEYQEGLFLYGAQLKYQHQTVSK